MIIKKIYSENEIKLDYDKLSDQNLDNLDLSNAILSGLDLSSSSLVNVRLSVAQLQKTNLENSNLSFANLGTASFENAKLKSALLEGVSASSVLFRNANLMEVNLKNSYLGGADLINANFEGADLTNANFERCVLYGTDMRGMNIETANFQGAVFDQNTKWPEGFNPYSKGAKIVVNPIEKLIEDLSWHLSKEIQENAIYELSKIKPQFHYLLFKSGKYTWPNAVKIVKQIGYPENKSAISNLFGLLMDTNWPGAIEAMEVLTEIKEKDKPMLIEKLEEVICKAYSDGDPCWLWGINYFIKYYAKLKEKDFFDSEIFNLLKYGDEEENEYDFGIHNFLKP